MKETRISLARCQVRRRRYFRDFKWHGIRSVLVLLRIHHFCPQYTATGQEAIDLATQAASLMAIVRTDRLNVRMEPNTDSKIWTQISKEERYPVEKQLGGWVQIDLDTGDSGNGEEMTGPTSLPVIIM